VPLFSKGFKRYNYLVHRWIGLFLGVMVFAWFVSGIVMMYYPYPVLTDSKKRALLRGVRAGFGTGRVCGGAPRRAGGLPATGPPIVTEPQQLIRTWGPQDSKALSVPLT